LPFPDLERFLQLDARLAAMRRVVSEDPAKLFRRTRTPLDTIVQTRKNCRNNHPQALLRLAPGRLTFTLGPQFDKGPTAQHFNFASGARLSFGVSLAPEGDSWVLLEYRFHLVLPEGSRPAFFRFDLNEKPHARPLDEPICHIHPGLDDLRLPCPVLHPLAIIDYLVFVIEPAFAS
jgi:hypothetical protein